MIFRGSGGDKRGRAAVRMLQCSGQNLGLFRDGDQIAITNKESVCHQKQNGGQAYNRPQATKDRQM